MLACYLDDSGTTEDRPFVTVAGYVMHADAWEGFERAGGHFLSARGVSLLHASDFYRGKGEFKGWPLARRAEFLSGLNVTFRNFEPFGVSAACLKQTFNQRKQETGLSKRQSPFGFAFNMAMNKIISDNQIGPTAVRDGIVFYLESGNKNNSGVRQSFARIKQEREAKFLLDAQEVGKTECIAIQMADFFAYFTRRRTEMLWDQSECEASLELFLRILRTGIRDVGEAATDFGPR